MKLEHLALLLALVICPLQATTWTEPQKLEGTWSTSPTLAVDTQGGAVVLWKHFDEEHEWIKGAIKPAGKSRSAPFIVSDACPHKSLTDPQVKFDPHGNAYAFWNSLEVDHTTLHMAILLAGSSTWLELETPFSTDNPDARSVDFAFDGSGDLLVAWNPTRFVETDSIVCARYSLESKTWQPVETLVEKAPIGFISLALDPAGNALLVWSEGSPSSFSDNSVLAATLPKGASSWSKPTTLYSGLQVWFSQVAVDAEGNAVAIWKAEDSSTKEWSIESALLPVGAKNWERQHIPGSLLTGDYSEFRSCQLRMDLAGNALAVWRYDEDDYPFKSSTLSFNDKAWSPAIDVKPADDEDSWYERIEIDGDGNAIFVWQIEKEDEAELLAVSLSAKNNASWSKPEIIANIHGLKSWPDIAFSSDRTCHIVYCDDFYPTYSVEVISGTNQSKKAVRGTPK